MRQPTDDAVGILQNAGARFVYLFGSRVEGTARADSDWDLAAYFGTSDIDLLTIMARLPGGCDMLVLDDAPLALAGRVAMRGKLLWEADPAERVAWEATTRKIYLDERPRMQRFVEDYKRGMKARGGS